MDRLERATESYLRTLFSGFVYEPNGVATAPDFSLENRIGVEVTHLVKVTQVGGQKINASQRHPSTIQSLENAIVVVQIPDFSRSYFVNMRIREPVDVRPAVRRLKEFLHDFYFRDEGSCENVSISDGLTISVDETHTIKETPFRLGAISGRDFSGWVGADLIRQCAEALERKSGIGTRVHSEYDQFWLAVGSNLTLGDRTEYVPLLIENLPKQSVFDKLLLIDANSPDRSIAIDLPW